MVYGAGSVTIPSVMLMQELSVGSWDFLQKVMITSSSLVLSSFIDKCLCLSAVPIKPAHNALVDNCAKLLIETLIIKIIFTKRIIFN